MEIIKLLNNYFEDGSRLVPLFIQVSDTSQCLIWASMSKLPVNVIQWLLTTAGGRPTGPLSKRHSCNKYRAMIAFQLSLILYHQIYWVYSHYQYCNDAIVRPHSQDKIPPQLGDSLFSWPKSCDMIQIYQFVLNLAIMDSNLLARFSGFRLIMSLTA